MSAPKKRALVLAAVILGILGIGGAAAAYASSDDAPGDDHVATVGSVRSVGLVPVTPTPVASPSDDSALTPAPDASLPTPSTNPTSGLPTDADHPQGDDSIGRIGGGSGDDNAVAEDDQVGNDNPGNDNPGNDNSGDDHGGNRGSHGSDDVAD
jgi:hypothetical protein